MKNIKINRVNLTQKQIDTIIEDKNTINLTNMKSTKQKLKNKIKIQLFISLAVLGLVFGLNVYTFQNISIEDEFTNEFEILLDQEVVEEEDLDELIEILQESVDSSQSISTVNNNKEHISEIEEIDTIPVIEEKVEDEIDYSINVEQKAFETIIKFEGYHDKPYWDIKQWSCGYGMKCSKDTTGITKEKSKWFVIERINKIREKHDLYKYDDNIEVALISFIYNIGHAPVGMDWYIRNNHINGLKNMMRKYSYAGGEYMRGLALRRTYETGLF